MNYAQAQNKSSPLSSTAPTMPEIREAHRELSKFLRTTPVWNWRSDIFKAGAKESSDEQSGDGSSESSGEFSNEATDVVIKLELLQHGGSFKPRGALQVMRQLDAAALTRGVTAVSAGNHAIAVSWAARVLGTSAKVVVPRTASPVRVAMCESYGGEVILVDDVHAAFARVREIEEKEGRAFVHPFEGAHTALGTATLGLEFAEQAQEIGRPLDALIVPVGGGGLIAGMAAAVKQRLPDCMIYGVEPIGADTMYRSFQSGQPESLNRVETIADSLGAPHTAPYSLSLCKSFVEEIVLVSDDEMRAAMALMYRELKIAPEPAGAASAAALIGPLRGRLRGKRVGIIACGGNIDVNTFAQFVERGQR